MCIDLDAVILVIDTREGLGRTSLKALVVQAESGVLEGQQLGPVSAPVEEHEQVAGERVHTEVVPRNGREVVELFAEVDRITGNEDPQGFRDAQHRSSSTSTRRWGSAASNPLGTTICGGPRGDCTVTPKGTADRAGRSSSPWATTSSTKPGCRPCDDRRRAPRPIVPAGIPERCAQVDQCGGHDQPSPRSRRRVGNDPPSSRRASTRPWGQGRTAWVR